MAVASLLLALAALDPDLAALRAADQRLADVSHRLQVANAALCPETVATLPGFTVQTVMQFAERDRARVARQLGLAAHPAVGVVARGSTTEGAGVRAGDPIVALDGVPTPPASGRRYAQAAATEKQVDQAFASPPVKLTLADRTVEVAGDRGCASRAQIVGGGFQKTGADGHYIQISQVMFDFAANDDELAAVTAHELAHNILRHAAKRTKSREAEYEADWLSVWLLARAGYNLDAIVPFWTRLGRRTDYGIFSDGTHPGWRKRVARLAEAVALAKAQRDARAPLVPPAAQHSASQAQNRR